MDAPHLFQQKKQSIMKTNVGAFDGWFRTLLFILSICAAIVLGGSMWLLVIPTSIFFLTAVLRWCPLYDLMGINTSKTY